ncbi:cell division cycle protein [Phaeosphaeriaceae sp. PMI808]|nr:cell division cycle protein [Phaeosphaeriaceae sp. PMI808]
MTTQEKPRNGETENSSSDARLTELPFPPVTKAHILNCSYHSWHPRYRTVTPKARLISLPPAFLDYLRSDGIILPPEESENPAWSDNDSGIFSGDDNNDDDDEETVDPSLNWRDTHESIERTIEELGGKVAPKLNWSAPKDATWINATNSMECRAPNDIYLLLKSSDFVTHDLEHAFDDTTDQSSEADQDIPYHLVLRKWITLNPSVEFRCFVRDRRLVALCQRDLNHFDFLFNMQDQLRDTVQDFFEARLQETFPDPNFTFDVYVPPPHDKVWLTDINPWAMRTDPLLFSWLELLTMDVPDATKVDSQETTIRLQIASPDQVSGSSTENITDGEDSDEDIEEIWQPEFRLVRRDDPEAYGFATPQYSAHKLPKDVVDAGMDGGGMREFAVQWQEAQKLAEQQQAEDSEDI